MSERDTRLAEIEARLQAATAGPWTNETEDSDGSRVVSEALPPEAAGVADAMDYHSPRTHNGEFIAHARDDVPFLLAGLAAKEQENTLLAAECDRYGLPHDLKMLLAHIYNNRDAAYALKDRLSDNQQQEIEKLRERLAEAER